MQALNALRSLSTSFLYYDEARPSLVQQRGTLTPCQELIKQQALPLLPAQRRCRHSYKLLRETYMQVIPRTCFQGGMSVGRQAVSYEEGVAPIYFHSRRMLHQHIHHLPQGFLKVRDSRMGGPSRTTPSAVASSWCFATLTINTRKMGSLALDPVLGSERGKSVKLDVISSASWLYPLYTLVCGNIYIQQHSSVHIQLSHSHIPKLSYSYRTS